MICRACGRAGGRDDVVLDLGEQPITQHLPEPGDPGPDPRAPLAMWCCRGCGLAQLAGEVDPGPEVVGVEPAAVRELARSALVDAGERGLLDGATVREFGSPHGGTWLDLLPGHRVVTDGVAEVVIDSLGLMHEPDQARAAGRLAAALAPGGTALVQFHDLAAIAEQRQWNALRHGHYAYYSTTALVRLLGVAGLVPVHALRHDLYGGSVVLALRHWAAARPLDGSVAELVARDAALGITEPAALAGLGAAAAESVRRLRRHLAARRAAGDRVVAYGAASRAVALFAIAGVGADQVLAVGDASPGKQGRALPGSRIPVVTPERLAELAPDEVLVTIPELLVELAAARPELADRLVRLDRVDD
ncbi:methyltransferase domain-containing protein [Naumannella huperziae]